MKEATIKKVTLRSFLKRQLFEDVIDPYQVAAGEEASSVEYPEEEIELPEEIPIEASEEMATQLSTQRPPVEDPDYVPANQVELGKAADVLVQQVPEGQVEFLYNSLQALVDDAIAKAANVEVAELEPPEIKMSEQVEMPVRMGLEDIADELGYSSASGARQDLERILKRVSYAVEGVGPEDLETLKLYGANEYITALASTGLIDKSDQREMRENPKEVMPLDSFRFFFVSGLILPAYQKIVRNSRKRVEAELDRLDVPRKAWQTVVNQVFGDTPKDIKKLQAKLNKVAQAEGVPQDTIKKTYGSLIGSLDILEKMAKLEGNLVVDAIESFGKASAKKKQRILMQALQSTNEFRDSGSR